MGDIHHLKPNKLGGGSATSDKIRKYSGGMIPDARQFDTADGPTPSISATLLVPPSSSIRSSTVSITTYNSKLLKMSTDQVISIDDSRDTKSDGTVGTRAEIIARLRQLPEVLGKTDGEIAEICGITAPQWSNYKSETIDVTIRPLVAWELWNAFGIPMEWVYDGQTARAEPAMRAKLATANRKAEAWLAGRRPPSRAHKARIVLILAVGASLAWGWPSGMGHAKHTPTSIVGDCRGHSHFGCQHSP